jgi:hypothetical protein
MKSQVLLLVLLTILNVHLVNAQEQSLTNAWKYYNSGNYREAIRYSEQCIDDFTRPALKIQHKLDSLRIVPETGAVNDVQKNRIFQNGLLNDVSTACFIKGKSAEYLYKQDKVRNLNYKQIATDAYNLASSFNKGRCWDPKGWFWSPSEASSQRLPIQ